MGQNNEGKYTETAFNLANELRTNIDPELQTNNPRFSHP